MLHAASDQVLRHFRETSRRPFMVGPSTASRGRAPRTRGTAVCIEEDHMTTLAIGTSTRGVHDRSSREARVRPAGIAFLATAAAFLTGTMLAASIAPGYDFHGAAISDLGVVDETALLFGGLLVIVGVLNIVGGHLYYRD